MVGTKRVVRHIQDLFFVLEDPSYTVTKGQLVLTELVGNMDGQEALSFTSDPLALSEGEQRLSQLVALWGQAVHHWVNATPPVHAVGEPDGFVFLELTSQVEDRICAHPDACALRPAVLIIEWETVNVQAVVKRGLGYPQEPCVDPPGCLLNDIDTLPNRRQVGVL